MENPTPSSTHRNTATEENRRLPSRRSFRIRPQYPTETSRKRSRIDTAADTAAPEGGGGGSGGVLQQLVENSENISAAIDNADRGADNGGGKIYAVVQQETQLLPPAASTTTATAKGVGASSQESENDYGIDFQLDDDEEKQLADIFESYAVAAKQIPDKILPIELSAIRGQVEGGVEHEREPARVLDIERLELLQGSDASLGGMEFHSPIVPRRLDVMDGAPLSGGRLGAEVLPRGAGQASGRFELQVEQAANTDIEQANKSTNIEPNTEDGGDTVDPDKALQSEAKVNLEVPVQETRSPMQLYRSRGKKREPRLSVTDLVMNLWCEQQFHYTLLRGFKRRTPAMKAGTAIHKEVEEEVHRVVPVKVKTPEDTWGLKIYNMLQGIETLRHGGVTRELEIWGWIDGVWTIGIVDEIRFDKDAYDAFSEKVKEEDEVPSKKKSKKAKGKDESGSEKSSSEKEEAAENDGSEQTAEKHKKKRGRPRKSAATRPDDGAESGGSSSEKAHESKVAEPSTPKKGKRQQASIDNFFSPTPTPSKQKMPGPKPVYIVDLKTRESDKPPRMTSSQGQMTFLQLMLYHRLLSDLLTSHPKLTTDYLCQFHKLDPQAPFSDQFIAQIASLEASDYSPSSTPGDSGGFESSSSSPSLLSLESLLEHNSIESLYGLFHEQLRRTVSAVLPELTAVYRWQANGEIIGATNFEFNPDTLGEHVGSVMSWWKGQRETVGVGIHDAWKCRSCDFYDQCAWRQKKIEEGEEALKKRREENTVKAGMSDIVVLKRDGSVSVNNQNVVDTANKEQPEGDNGSIAA